LAPFPKDWIISTASSTEEYFTLCTGFIYKIVNRA
jgi:hypothetical protein